MTREIPLNGLHGGMALVDDEDYARLSQYRWHQGKKGYVESSFRVDGRTTTIRMHRLVLQVLPRIEVDHINRNKLDNRRDNLRPATSASNKWNKQNQRSNKHGYQGVFAASRSARFIARISTNGVVRHLGTFDTPEDAARAYESARAERDGRSS